ncbi:MAG: hypothetical protein HRU06_09085 [Oceanospirillaceae bacterium]|nr:hypothetical protein [Oceanospirillaceae bacterium]
MQPQHNALEIPPRPTSLLEYLSPFGVISTSEFAYRLLSFVGLLLVSVMIFAWSSSFVIYLEEIGQQDAASLVYPLVGVIAFFLFWFLLSTLTKEYRTSGMPIPFIFALFTYILPFFFIFRYLLSSKKKRAINSERAAKQAEYRKNEKGLPKKSKILDSD